MDFSLASNLMNWLAVPFLLWTLKDVAAGWRSMWDDNLTSADRSLLLRFTVFLLLPIVVFFHELGHLLAAWSVGVQVAGFHYGPVMGYVETYPSDDPLKELWITFAGNLVQILIGLASLFVAWRSKSPPVVAVSVYFGLYTIAATVVFYAMLSLSGFYGDWIQMYTNAYKPGVIAIVFFQIMLIAGLSWAMFSAKAKIWFTAKTNPHWLVEHKALQDRYQAEPDLKNTLLLARSYLQAGLAEAAKKLVQKAEKLAPGHPGVAIIKAEILLKQGKPEEAQRLLQSLAGSSEELEALLAQNNSLLLD
ncbi:MAG: M50 family metallopeptidase [Candidatus Obscuribacterales bacterium]|nr:M50 family metallopeptidase [Candidatus Obscuribacterales bacterium]